MNIIVATGMVFEPPTKVGNGDKLFAKARIGIQRPFKNAQGKYESDFVDLFLIDKQAKYAIDYIKKGDIICVQGSLRNDYSVDDFGNKKANGKSHIEVIMIEKVRNSTSLE